MSLTQPPQITVLRPMYPDNDIQGKVRLALGTAFHNEVQNNVVKLKKRIVFRNSSEGFYLTGTPDMETEWTSVNGKTVSDTITDIKVTSIYKIKKTIVESNSLLPINSHNFPYDIDELRKIAPNSFDWIYQLSCYNYLIDESLDRVGLIIAVSFDSGNMKIKNTLKTDFNLLNIHPIIFPIIPPRILSVDIKRRWIKLKKMQGIIDTYSITNSDRTRWAEIMDESGLRCSKEDTWDGTRCKRYCNLKDVCFGKEGSPTARWEE